MGCGLITSVSCETVDGWCGLSPPPLILPLSVRSSSMSSTVPSRAWSKTCSSQRSMSDAPLLNAGISSAARRCPRRLDPPSSATNLPWCRLDSVRNFAPAGTSGTCRDTHLGLLYVAFHTAHTLNDNNGRLWDYDYRCRVVDLTYSLADGIFGKWMYYLFIKCFKRIVFSIKLKLQ